MIKFQKGGYHWKEEIKVNRISYSSAQNGVPNSSICASKIFVKNVNFDAPRKSKQIDNLHRSASVGKRARPKQTTQSIQISLSNLLSICSKKTHDNFYYYLLKLILSGDVETNPGPMYLETYNVRGMRKYDKMKRILNHAHKINSFDSGVIALQETYLNLQDTSKLDIMWRGQYVISPGTANSCGVLILYSNKSFDNVIYQKGYDNGRCSILIAESNGVRQLFAAIYGPTLSSESIQFYSWLESELLTLQHTHEIQQFFILGDLNCTLGQNDSVNRKTSSIELKTRFIINTISTTFNLIDLFPENQESKYTWMRGDTLSRLDYVLGPQNLKKHVKTAEVRWNVDKSDHACLQISINDLVKKGPGIPRCRVYLLETPEYNKMFCDRVEEFMQDMHSNWDPHKKLDFLKVAIRSAIKEINCLAEANRTNILNVKLDELEKIKLAKQNNILNHVSNTQIETDIAILEQEVDELLVLESKRLAEISRVNWIEKGEKSNKYFLNLLKRRERSKMISTLSDGNSTAKCQSEIEDLANSFYKNLYSAKSDNNKDFSEFFDLINIPQISEDDRNKMDASISLEELLATIKSCKDSAPGPDGIQYSLYRHTWKYSGQILLDAWNYSISTGNLPTDNKCSIISLLEKKGKDPNQIKNLRPISLTNCDLKVFTKLLSNRLNICLKKVLHRSQSAYLPGRQVQDNLRLLDLVLQNAKLTQSNSCMVALDAAKAFDSVSHGFIVECLDRYGFSPSTINITKMLYNQIEAKVMINGHLTKGFGLERGVKQGDALSCGLFILCMDPLIRSLEANEAIPSCSINNVVIDKTAAYADDITIITNDHQDSITQIIKTYDIFSSFSGLYLNVEKTEILSPNRDVNYSWNIDQSNLIKNSEKVKVCGKTFEHQKGESLIDIQSKINSLKLQLNMWKSRNLTTEGRILISKVFGMSQIIYIMQNQTLSDNLLNEIEKIIYDFIWFKKAGKKALI